MAQRYLSVINVSLVVLALLACVSADGLSVEEQLQQLRENLIETKETLTSKISQLETQLEAEIQQNDDLEEKVEALELKVAQQEARIVALQSERPPTFYSDGISRQGSERHVTRRTCSEIRSADPTSSSGWYWIDPDGQDINGDDPIFVFCNMDTGTTSIPHDNESKTEVGYSPGEKGKYSRAITYNATLRQMAALAELSNRCQQLFRYDCSSAPFEINGEAYSWWNDRNGIARYFWSGNNPNIHTCQCGIEEGCAEKEYKCNCDARLYTPLTDAGFIYEKNLLPITRLNFGGVDDFGEYTLGRFECVGEVAMNKIPTSCADLWRQGHGLNGLYSVMGTKMIETVYCDFTKLPNDPGIQTWIGYVDVKSTPVYFYVQKTRTHGTLNNPIPFEYTRLNIGGAMNLGTGIFTAPKAGTYFFSISAQAVLPSSSGFVDVGLVLNNAVIGITTCNAIDGRNMDGNDWEVCSLQSTLNLQRGDRVWLTIPNKSGNSYLNDNGSHYTHFTGWLLQEDITPLLM